MKTTLPDGEPLSIAVRAYVCKADQSQHALPQKIKPKKIAPPSEWVVVFDTETTTDATQKLRFGTFQVRKGTELMQEGIFYDPKVLNKTEQWLLTTYTDKHQLALMNVQAFIEDIFFGIGYALRATIVGFNLPFDISRLAIDHATARASSHNKIMRGGFTFKLSENPYHPRVQIKHISSRDAFIQFAAVQGQRTSRGKRKKGYVQPVRRGFFVDTKTLAAALTSQSHSLASLAKALGVEAQKYETEDHGRRLTKDYIDYARQDTQTTWECYDRLQALYASYGLQLTAEHNIHSEASLGKAYLREMGIKPWRQQQLDFPDDLLGIIMSAYYGGRSEVHIRRVPVQVLYCDFLSMYPTVCTLMGLWRFVKAQGMSWEDSTEETRIFLDVVEISDVLRQETWRSLCTLVQVMPEGDIFPVRARYGGDAQYTIGSNFLTSQTPLWFTLADCISSKLLTGRVPKILRAIAFTPVGQQEDLRPVCVAGNADYTVNPLEGDFFKRVIDLRRAVKNRMSSVSPEEKADLDRQQLALKILANATSYGIFVELNVEEEKQSQSLRCYGYGSNPLPVSKKKFEATGAFFHPLLAALITGAARLMLATTERLAVDAGLDWAFCDTDSMALARPENMEEKEFLAKAQQVQEWFTPLNPYSHKSPLLKIEDYNYQLPDKKTLQPLYCYAVSSKRYALFNREEQGEPVIRKVSAHGLGHLIAPYTRDNAQDLEGSQPWQQDLWQEIIKAALHGTQPNFSHLQNFNLPAVSRYAATTPKLERWFQGYNEDRSYSDRVRPFNFLLAHQALPNTESLMPVAPYHRNPSESLAQCFDRNSGKAIDKTYLKTYLDVLAQYHLHPETKFLHGDYLDKGITQRRHIVVKSIQHIGKEANKWEEQFFTGFDSDAQIEYGISPEHRDELLNAVIEAIGTHGAKCIADAAKLSQHYVLNIYKGMASPSDSALKKLLAAINEIELFGKKEQEIREKINNIMKGRNISIRYFAAQLKIDPSNLSKILSGRRGNFEKLEYILKELSKVISVEIQVV